MFAVALISLSPPCSAFPGSRSLSRESAIVDSMVMRFPFKPSKLGSGSPTGVVFRPTKWLSNPLSLSPNNLMVLSAFSSSKHPDRSSGRDGKFFLDPKLQKEYDEAFNYDLGKESDFTISLPWEEVSIFIKRLLKDTDTGFKKLKITIMYNNGPDQVFVDRFVKGPSDAEDGDCDGGFNFASKIKFLLWTTKPKPEPVKIEIKVMSRESQLCVLTETSTISSSSYPFVEKSD